MHRTFHGATNRRLAVIAQRMRVAPRWQLPHLALIWLRELAR